MDFTGYSLSRAWFDFCFENPEKISPGHTAIYFFAIEHCNRMGWKEKFGFPTQMAMEAIGIKKYDTYTKYLNQLIEWGFLKMIQKSTNQYSANIISLTSAYPKNGEALGKAMVKHGGKQGESTGESKGSIDKPITYNQEPLTSTPREQVIEFLRRAAPVSIQQAQIEEEADKLLKQYSGTKIKNLQALCNTWMQNVQEGFVIPKKPKTISDYV